MGALDSPVTSYLRRSVAVYGLIPELVGDDDDGDDDDDDDNAALLNQKKKGKGKPSRLIDSETSTNIETDLFHPGGGMWTKELDEETGLASMRPTVSTGDVHVVMRMAHRRLELSIHEF
jgi:hypothetical protein